MCDVNVNERIGLFMRELSQEGSDKYGPRSEGTCFVILVEA